MIRAFSLTVHMHTSHAMISAFPPSGLRDIIDKTAKYVGRNGDEFAKVIREKHPADPRYEFLLPWNPLHKYGVQVRASFYCTSCNSISSIFSW